MCVQLIISLSDTSRGNYHTQNTVTPEQREGGLMVCEISYRESRDIEKLNT